MLLLDKLRVKCESFMEIESEMVKLLGVLDWHTARHLFRSRHLKSILCKTSLSALRYIQILSFTL